MKQRLIFLLSLLTFISISTGAYAADAGKILFVYGKAQLERNGKTIVAKKGLAVKAGDLITTFRASSLQIKLSDNSLVALRPNTVWNLKEYLYDKANPSLGKQGSELIKGGLRAVTGLIGKADPKKITYSAGTTTIGIRGTSFEMATRGSAKSFELFVKVETGQVEVKNSKGSLRLYADDMARIIADKAPEHFLDESIFIPINEEIHSQKHLGYKQKTATGIFADSSKSSSSEEEDAILQDTEDRVADNLRRLTYTETSQPLPILSYAKFAKFLQDQGFTDGDNKILDESKLILNSQTNDFFQSKGKFKQRGYKELKVAFHNLTNEQKTGYTSADNAIKHPLNALEKAVNFKILQIKGESAPSPEFEFSRVKELPSGTSFQSGFNVLDDFENNKSIYLKKGNNYHKYSLEHIATRDDLRKRIYTFIPIFSNGYKLNDTKFKVSAYDIASFTKIQIDFREANRAKIVGAELAYQMTYDRNRSIQFQFTQPSANSYINADGIIYIDFEKIQAGIGAGLKDDTLEVQTGKAFLTGSLYNNIAGADIPYYINSIFSADIKLGDAFKSLKLKGELRTGDTGVSLGDKIKHIGYVKFFNGS